jgi:hypothetical protein
MKTYFIIAAVALTAIFTGLSPAKADDYFNINWSFIDSTGTTSDSLSFCTGAGC